MALETDLIVVEEEAHTTSICVVVTSGSMVVTSSLTVSTLGGSATCTFCDRERDLCTYLIKWYYYMIMDVGSHIAVIVKAENYSLVSS